LWYTPVSGFTHTMPAFFVCDVHCFTEPEDAGVVGAGVVEGEEGGVGFAELGAVAGVAVAGGLSEMLDCGAWASSPERFAALAVTDERSHEQRPSPLLRVTFHRFAFIEVRAHWNRGSLEFRHDGEESG
jgi:hypothetical protein